jgi:hypothetical protein
MIGKRKYEIEGQLTTKNIENLPKVELSVHAFIAGAEIAHAIVDKNGRYKLSLEYESQLQSTELRVIPAKFSATPMSVTGFSRTISPNRFIQKTGVADMYTATVNFSIPDSFVVYINRVAKKYNMKGEVYSYTGTATNMISVDIVKGVKIEFWQFDMKLNLPKSERYLGEAYTDNQGHYEFSFGYTYLKGTIFGINKVPDIRARIFQFVGGVWKEIFSSPVDWDIVQDFHRDYFIPATNVMPVPDSGTYPSVGFRFCSIGLLDIDLNHIKEGYAFANPEDDLRIRDIHHQPFCGTLRIFGLFAQAPKIAKYKVQIADATKTGAIIQADTKKPNWKDLSDQLLNRKYNTVTKLYDPIALGPDSSGHYINVDIDPELDWHEHALKITWNTANVPNGYYAMKIIGYEQDNKAHEFIMDFVLKIYNNAPTAKIEVIDPSADKCGALKLKSERKICFNVIAFDPEDHILRYWIQSTRGKSPESSGNNIVKLNGTNINGVQETFLVAPVPPCKDTAYNFELWVQGSPTDCYSVELGSMLVRVETNLIVSEP